MSKCISSALAVTLASFSTPCSGAEPFVLDNSIFKKLHPSISVPLPPKSPRMSGCPDIRVTANQVRSSNGYSIVTVKVVNTSNVDYLSGRGQQALVINRQAGSVKVPFTNLRRGDEIVWRDRVGPSEHPITYSIAISFDPDIFVDGNPQNDDCRRSNNRAVLKTTR